MSIKNGEEWLPRPERRFAAVYKTSQDDATQSKKISFLLNYGAGFLLLRPARCCTRRNTTEHYEAVENLNSKQLLRLFRHFGFL